jgi:hypothetical protein
MHSFNKPVVKVENSGVGFCGLLTLLLVAFKLTSVIDWSWLWIFAPIWAPWLLALTVVGVALTASLVAAAFNTPKKNP